MSTVQTGEIIILSDDDDISENDLSCLIVEVEGVKNAEDVQAACTPDEDLVVTFARRADVLPHARYDCPVHPFTFTDCETLSPVANNQLFCEQCYCYICDKLASLCVLWTYRGICHCNSLKSLFWNNIRNRFLLGGLFIFNLTPSEVDTHLRNAESMLRSFKQELSTLISYSISGEMPLQNNCVNQQVSGPNDHSVFEFVISFLNKADKQECKSAAILNLGALHEFMHILPKIFSRQPPVSSAPAKMIVQRVITSVQKLMVTANFTPEFLHKLQDFFTNKINLPNEMKSMKNSLNVRPWDDILLVSVLKGQNVSGIRKGKGKTDILFEQISLVQLRSEFLQHQRRYRELCRYLQVIRTDNPKYLKWLQSVIPFFLCLESDFTSALTKLFPYMNTPAVRFTTQIFLFYLRIFETATAPKMIVSNTAQLCCSAAPSWDTVNGGVPLKHVELVKFALQALRFSSEVYADSECWTRILRIVNSPHSISALPEPCPQFLHDARREVDSILLNDTNTKMRIPPSFLEVYPDQALLLLVTGGLSLKILNTSLSPAASVLRTYKNNLWAFRWLHQGLLSHGLHLEVLPQETTKHGENTNDIKSYVLEMLHQNQTNSA